jgi:hypothetical protein
VPHVDATRIYAKVDLARLREVADFDLDDWRIFLLHDIAATNSLEPIGVGHYQSV